jgi:hypothetical protein
MAPAIEVTKMMPQQVLESHGLSFVQMEGIADGVPETFGNRAFALHHIREVTLGRDAQAPAKIRYGIFGALRLKEFIQAAQDR